MKVLQKIRRNRRKLERGRGTQEKRAGEEKLRKRVTHNIN